jgi:hypothetical protein
MPHPPVASQPPRHDVGRGMHAASLVPCRLPTTASFPPPPSLLLLPFFHLSLAFRTHCPTLLLTPDPTFRSSSSSWGPPPSPPSPSCSSPSPVKSTCRPSTQSSRIGTQRRVSAPKHSSYPCSLIPLHIVTDSNPNLNLFYSYPSIYAELENRNPEASYLPNITLTLTSPTQLEA